MDHTDTESAVTERPPPESQVEPALGKMKLERGSIQTSNLNHAKRKLNKAGQSRWLGRRPIVRGVAMNPVDHPHGGGEGRNRPSKEF
ncbi:hypothetical protein Mp_1g19370 [Marchantia polymorpha subsp. ruderalis]|uniref:Large ribosomal subunit protein uL2 C-terminal domain-containing protein n=2 Tax=Marchantia polymorpha TaxID=3197 RepID=A0AAF6ARV8_MARPO|nr:hypothetical protein MARPO_0001s0275 [Marchantia polymorpha]BBM99178.1 hypothetical protein Mp_1g19370 [Marchantia polymorpha subsp. ruderalis]|eukprot:PTQ50255.1 hypothetical protein MARPO_0001s0275 [Marchantia polymorpha]